MTYVVTPWEVKGEVDYDRLVKQFGVEKINDIVLKRIEKHTKELHFMLRRKVFFAHRDLNWVLNEYEKGNKFYLYTGRAPSGPVHLGHMMPWLFTKWLQDKFEVDLWFQFPDEEKFLFKDNLTLEDTTEKYLQDNMLDLIALGFDPKKTKFLIDTKNADLMYKEACRVAKKITFSTVKAAFGLTDQSNIGEIFYTSMQAVPAFLPSVLKNKKIPCVITHAVDQDVHFRVTRDILPKIGHYKPASIQCMFLPPLTGSSGKMSASEQSSALYTTDTPEEAAKKIRKYAFSGGQATIEEHRKKGGNPDIDVSYQWLRMMFEPDDKKLEKIYQDYKSGALLTGELKEILIEKVTYFLKEHQKNREKAKKQVNKFLI
ncbi:tryptophan--tRNA ligase [Candidatus Woesearchaeota archaeon]|nr:tryptophan--tRNA ligase [Candidatus Woesearchaeota archaeon]